HEPSAEASERPQRGGVAHERRAVQGEERARRLGEIRDAGQRETRGHQAGRRAEQDRQGHESARQTSQRMSRAMGPRLASSRGANQESTPKLWPASVRRKRTGSVSNMTYVHPPSCGTLRIPMVTFAAMPIATSEPRRVARPSMSVTAMNVSVISVIQPKKVQCGIITFWRKSL